MAKIIKAYCDNNTPELRQWLQSIGLFPLDYPDSTRYGLTAPYHRNFYKDGVRYDTDNDANEFTICKTEEEFKDLVLQLIEKI